jgi:hypothetical protein
MTAASDSSSVPLARLAPVPPPVPPAQLPYTFIGDPPRKRGFIASAGLCLAGVLGGAAAVALSVTVLMHLGPGVSVASVLARIVSLAVLFAPIPIARRLDRRLRAGVVLPGALFPVIICATQIVPNAFLM